jgi:hypothetical protein
MWVHLCMRHNVRVLPGPMIIFWHSFVWGMILQYLVVCTSTLLAYFLLVVHIHLPRLWCVVCVCVCARVCVCVCNLWQNMSARPDSALPSDVHKYIASAFLLVILSHVSTLTACTSTFLAHFLLVVHIHLRGLWCVYVCARKYVAQFECKAWLCITLWCAQVHCLCISLGNVEPCLDNHSVPLNLCETHLVFIFYFANPC